ncbi:hypothetical protein FQN60_005686 [Etheostoma spectabile]|uniref:Uncharacterized protein n=1 Tax=Etheostoma spectabile TaxID=54343 RepID=A0A5J5CJ15_9PERO|nr:hypothetical protein FQN60_005686 [Etheostoma spectabile]
MAERGYMSNGGTVPDQDQTTEEMLSQEKQRELQARSINL